MHTEHDANIALQHAANNGWTVGRHFTSTCKARQYKRKGWIARLLGL